MPGAYRVAFPYQLPGHPDHEDGRNVGVRGGFFNDLIVASETQVLFKEKIVVCDSSRIDTLLVIPI
jgi:hypothetical protein